MRESPWTRRCWRLIWKKQNALMFAVVASTMQESGWPDRYVAHKLWSGWLEFKNPKTRITDKQLWVIRELRARGANAYVIRRTQTTYSPDETLLICDHQDILGKCTPGTMFLELAARTDR